MSYKEIQVIDSGTDTVTTHIVIEFDNGTLKTFPADPTNVEYVNFLKELQQENEGNIVPTTPPDQPSNSVE